jgi:hypothetical protein
MEQQQMQQRQPHPNANHMQHRQMQPVILDNALLYNTRTHLPESPPITGMLKELNSKQICGCQVFLREKLGHHYWQHLAGNYSTLFQISQRAQAQVLRQAIPLIHQKAMQTCSTCTTVIK